MKSKELIRLLQEQDPSGEIEVCVGNVDIHFLSCEPAYYDGPLQVLTRDESKKPYYNITGGMYFTSGSKLKLHLLSFRDVIENDPDTAVIEYSELSSGSAEITKQRHEEIRQATRDCEKQAEMDMFFSWAKSKAIDIYPGDDFEDLKDESERFYEKYLSPNDPLKKLPPTPDKDGNMWGPSIVQCRESEWDDTIVVRFNKGYWEIVKRND
jgi:hypothetical protein